MIATSLQNDACFSPAICSRYPCEEIESIGSPNLSLISQIAQLSHVSYSLREPIHPQPPKSPFSIFSHRWNTGRHICSLSVSLLLSINTHNRPLHPFIFSTRLQLNLAPIPHVSQIQSQAPFRLLHLLPEAQLPGRPCPLHRPGCLPRNLVARNLHLDKPNLHSHNMPSHGLPHASPRPQLHHPTRTETDPPHRGIAGNLWSLQHVVRDLLPYRHLHR